MDDMLSLAIADLYVQTILIKKRELSSLLIVDSDE